MHRFSSGYRICQQKILIMLPPIIMGATMFIQQKMTPYEHGSCPGEDDACLAGSLYFMFLNFPSGLVLYWLVNNILTIAQQAYM
jgi:YidC/Oxa1 family membrane protein insertase